MRLRNQQLVHHLGKATLAPIYWIASNEMLLLQEAKSLIFEAARKAGYSERERIEVAPAFDWSLFQRACQNTSLFHSKVLIDLNLGSLKLSAEARKLLIHYANYSPSHKLLVISTPNLSASVQQQSWVKTLEKSGVLVQIWPISSAEWPGWFNQRLQKAGLKLDKQALQLLSDNTEGNLLAASQVIEKLCLLYSKNPPPLINEQHVQWSLTDMARFNVYQLIEEAMEGNTSKSLRILESLRADNVSPNLILGALSHELHRLTHMAQFMRTHPEMSTHALFEKYGVWKKQKKRFQEQLRHKSFRQWWSLLVQLRHIDCQLKGVENNQAWSRIIDVLVELSPCTVP